MEKGCVFNTQRYSVHDGPGIRTVVFLKGCPLRCEWCCNPESQLVMPEVACNPERCIGDVCHLCAKVCPQQNIAILDNGKIWINHENCVDCLACAKECPADAITVYGKYYTVDEVLREVEKDLPFYGRSGGGMTVSGGEPLMQAGFTLELLKEAKNRGINTAMETCGAMPYGEVREIFGYLDFVHFDIKSLDPEKHKQWTGHDNSMILDTFKRMREEYPELTVNVRTPIVPGFNDTEEDIAGIRDLVKSFPNTTYEVLKYHRYGMTKYEFLGMEYKLGYRELPDGLFEQLKEVSLA